MVKVIKFSGEYENFSSNKIFHTLIRAGASKQQSNEIIKKLKKIIYKHMTTEEILNFVFKELKKTPIIAARYDLKRAIMNLGPAGYTFERYFSQILKNYGYQTLVNKFFKGKNITQEVDIVAKKESCYMVECKYHNHPGKYTNTKQAMYTYARFLDINSNKKFFDFPWLVTNTRCSNSVIKYSKGINLKITSWKYPKNGNLQELIETKKLYPITILKSVNENYKKILFQKGIIMTSQLRDIDIIKLKKLTNIPMDDLKKIVNFAKEI
ncbi:ATPase [Candidatus Pacearchaeota archaeon]|nr:ATPase [Candidatus Pacearchaeota archaeon]